MLLPGHPGGVIRYEQCFWTPANICQHFSLGTARWPLHTDHIGSTKALKIEKTKTKKIGPHIFVTVLVLLSAHVERVSVARMQDFFCWFLLVCKGYGGSQNFMGAALPCFIITASCQAFSRHCLHMAQINDLFQICQHLFRHQNNLNLDMCPWSPSSPT